MTDSVIYLAQQQLQAARDKVFCLESFLQTYSDIQSSAGKKQDEVVHRAGSQSAAPDAAPRTSGKMGVTEQVGSLIIHENGGPVPTAEMLDRLVSRGVEVGGKKPISTLSARLSRAPFLKFESGKAGRCAAPHPK